MNFAEHFKCMQTCILYMIFKPATQCYYLWYCTQKQVILGNKDSLSRFMEDLQARRWNLSGDIHPWQVWHLPLYVVHGTLCYFQRRKRDLPESTQGCTTAPHCYDSVNLWADVWELIVALWSLCACVTLSSFQEVVPVCIWPMTSEGGSWNRMDFVPYI